MVLKQKSLDPLATKAIPMAPDVIIWIIRQCMHMPWAHVRRKDLELQGLLDTERGVTFGAVHPLLVTQTGAILTTQKPTISATHHLVFPELIHICPPVVPIEQDTTEHSTDEVQSMQSTTLEVPIAARGRSEVKSLCVQAYEDQACFLSDYGCPLQHMPPELYYGVYELGFEDDTAVTARLRRRHGVVEMVPGCAGEYDAVQWDAQDGPPIGCSHDPEGGQYYGTVFVGAPYCEDSEWENSLLAAGENLDY